MIRRLWRRQPIAMTGFVLAALVTVFFLVRLTVQTVYWADPSHKHLPPQPWMTVGYVARSWGIDPRALVDAAGLPAPQHRPGHHSRTLGQIATERGMSVKALISEIQDALRSLQAQEDRN